MRVLQAAAELFPIVRTGGLGDVLAALPPAEAAAGADVRLLLPGYPAVLEALADAAATHEGRFADAPFRLVLGRFPGYAPPIYAIDAPALFGRPGNPYLGPDGLDWPDNAERFGLLGWAAAQVASGAIDPGWSADILHAHDWHVGLAAAYVRFLDAGLPRPGTVYTVHNLAFQGLFPPTVLGRLGLPPAAFYIGGLEYWGQISFMKAGLVYADRVTTVSPTYAREIATPEFGFGLEGVIAARGSAVVGILNGVDTDHWDPARDPALESRYEVDSLDRRAGNRAALLREFGLADQSGPLFGVVSRLTVQKGLDLLLDCLDTLVGTGAGLVLLGAGDQDLEEGFTAATRAQPTRIGCRLGYDDPLSHRIMAGSDAILVPSRFEPCGLTQLYALRFGAVPVVRRTGGLADTVVDADEAALAAGRATGIVFDEPAPAALATALERTAALYRDRPRWRAVQETGMRQHFSWPDAARSYLELYRDVMAGP